MPKTDKEKKDHEDKLKALKDEAQANEPNENQKKNERTVHVKPGKIKFGGVEEDVDIITETNPNATGGYDVKVYVPYCPIASVTQQ